MGLFSFPQFLRFYHKGAITRIFKSNLISPLAEFWSIKIILEETRVKRIRENRTDPDPDPYRKNFTDPDPKRIRPISKKSYGIS